MGKLKGMHFDIVGKKKFFYAISILITIAGLISFFAQGLNLGIDFTGGNYIQIQFEEKIDVTELRHEVDQFVSQSASVQESEDNTYNIRTEVMSEADAQTMIETLEQTFGTLTVERNELVGPTIGSELTRSAIIALAIACVLMIVYITIRFQFLFGVAAIIALLHDAFIVLALFSIFQLEISSSFIAAILTVIGYSINANIVIFDRVRENKPMYKQDKLKDLLNDSISETVARIVNTLLTTLFALLAVFFFGGETTRVFVGAIIIGVICGGYSCSCLSGCLYYDMKRKFGKDK